MREGILLVCFFFQAEDGIRDLIVTGVQTCALPISALSARECMRRAGVERVDHVAISRNPRAHLWRKVVEGAKHPAAWPRIASRVGNLMQIGRASCRERV